MNLTKEDKDLIARNAIQAAQHFCCERCFADYPCGKDKKPTAVLPLFGANNECPLAKYNVPLWKPKDFFDCRGEATENELFWLCANCKHCSVSRDGDDIVTDKGACFATICIDCPVQSMLDNIQECAAEAAMS